MTQADMYRELIRRNRYGYDGCYPSTRYENRKDIKYMDFNNVKIDVDGYIFKANEVEVTSDYDNTVVTASAKLYPWNPTSVPTSCSDKYSTPAYNKTSKHPTIENVIFNPPATIVFWSDKTKTIVKCDYDYEYYDPEKGIAMAIAKKLMGDNKGNYYELFKHWKKKWDEQNVSPDNPPDTNTPLNNLSEKIKSIFNVPKEVVIDDLIP